MAACEKAIATVLEKRAIQKDNDVEELYLSNESLTEVVDLQRFHYLKRLWLNGNKLRRVACMTNNYQLAELYLHDNSIVDVTGTMQHLTCLRVLFLHNNQLTKLERVLAELKKMQSLKTLNLFDNPVAQESGYRLFVVNSMPSVDLLDRKEVLKSERVKAKKIHDQDKEKIHQTIAFGRRIEGPPMQDSFHRENRPPLRTDPGDIGNNFLRDCQPFEDPEEAVNVRRLKKSIAIYTSFDWSKVPRIEERRQTDDLFDSPELITHVYR